MQADILRAPVGPGAMHVERYGHGGTAVILLHGFGTCNFLWRAIAPAITAAGHTAYSVDLLGHGQSDRPLDADFGIAPQAEVRVQPHSRSNGRCATPRGRAHWKRCESRAHADEARGALSGLIRRE